jgi:hypothetical protein
MPATFLVLSERLFLDRFSFCLCELECQIGHVREIMSERSCQRDYVREIITERSCETENVRGSVSEESCQRTCVRVSLSTRLCLRNHVREIISEGSNQRDHVREIISEWLDQWDHVKEHIKERVTVCQSRTVGESISHSVSKMVCQLHHVRVGSISRVSSPVLTAFVKILNPDYSLLTHPRNRCQMDRQLYHVILGSDKTMVSMLSSDKTAWLD